MKIIIKNICKTIQELEDIQHETITKSNKTNNENIPNINKEYNDNINNLTALNQLLISGLENIKETSFIDRVTNKNKQIASKLIKDNVKKLPTYEVLETKKK